jgi:hypothetical protein
MAWIDRLTDHVPNMPESVGTWALIGGAVGMGAALILANLPLAIGALVLTIAGGVGPALSAMKREKPPPEANLSPSQEAEEDAAVTAFVRRMEAAERFQAMAASEERPPCGRLH